MLLKFKSKQVADLTIDRNKMTDLEDESFSCTFNNETQQFDRIVQLRTCPLPESKVTCDIKVERVNSAVMAGSEFKLILNNSARGVQLECWALNPYKLTAFPKVRQSTWRITMEAGFAYNNLPISFY